MHDLLRNKWINLWKRMRAQGDPIGAFDEIITCYGEEHRKFHSLSNLTRSIIELEEILICAKSCDAVELALWYLDIIHLPDSSNNEHESASLFLDMSETWDIPIDFQNKVSNMIAAVRGHSPSTDPDTQLLIDIDLSIFGHTPGEYDQYEHQIRKEYLHLSWEQYAPERKKILDGFMRREPLYHTPYMREKYENIAKSNLKRTINKLISTPL